MDLESSAACMPLHSRESLQASACFFSPIVLVKITCTDLSLLTQQMPANMSLEHLPNVKMHFYCPQALLVPRHF